MEGTKKGYDHEMWTHVLGMIEEEFPSKCPANAMRNAILVSRILQFVETEWNKDS